MREWVQQVEKGTTYGYTAGGNEGVWTPDEHEGVFFSRLREVQIMGTLGGDEGVLYTR